MASKEQLNFFRLLCAILDVLSNILRDLLFRELPPSNFPSQNKKAIAKLNLNDDQSNIVKGIPTMGYQKCDITLLYKLLRNLCNFIQRPTKGWESNQMPESTDVTFGDDIQRIRIIRNMALGHLSSSRVSNSNFKYYWTIIKDICYRTRKGTHFGSNHPTDFVHELEVIETCRFNKESSEYYSRNLDTTVYTKTSLPELKDLLKSIIETVDIPQDLLEEMQAKIVELENMDHFHYTVCELTREVSEVVLRRSHNSSQPENHISKLREYSNETTKGWEEEKKSFLSDTKVFSALKSVVAAESMIAVIGGPGSGKKSTIRYVALDFRPEWETISVSHPLHVLKMYDENSLQLFVLDEFLGNFSVGNCTSDLNLLEDLINMFTGRENNKPKCIISCRRQVYSSNEVQISGLFTKCTIFDMEDQKHSLTKQEKGNMLSLHCRNKNVKTEVYKNIPLPDSNLLFPLLCRMFSENTLLPTHGEDFFKRPFGAYTDEICNLESDNKFHYALLLLCLFKNKATSKNEFIKEKMQLFSSIFDTSQPDEECILTGLQEINNTYIYDSEENFTFVNDVLYEVLAKHVSSLNADLVLRYMYHSEYIYRNITVSSDKNILFFDNPVRQNVQSAILQRLYTDITDHGLFDILSYDFFLDDNFTENFISFLDDCDSLEKFDFTLFNKIQLTEYKVDPSTYILQFRLFDWIISTGNKKLFSYAFDRIKRQNRIIKNAIVGVEKNVQLQTLFLALHSREKDIFETLLQMMDHGFINESWNICGKTLLVEACKLQCTEIVDVLLRNKVDPNKEDANKDIPLHIAAQNGSLSLVESLLNSKNRTLINKRDHNRRTALHLACKYGSLEVVNKLLHYGAKIDITDIKNNPPLIVALENGHYLIAETLLSKQTDVSKFKKSPLIVCIEKKRTDLCFKYLLSNRHLINKCDDQKQSPLFKASANGCIEIVEHLVQKKADATLSDINKMNPLHIAAKNRNLEIIKCLISHSGRSLIDSRDKFGRTALHIASTVKENEDIVKYLIQKGANPNLTDNEGITPLQYASENGFLDNVESFFNVKTHVDIDKINKRKMNPLMLALSNGHFKVCEYLIKHGANVNIIAEDCNCPLSIAIEKEDKDLVQYLIKKGAKVNNELALQNSLVFLALSKNLIEIVYCLIKEIRDVNAFDANGSSLLHLATEKKLNDFVSKLVCHCNANVFAKNNNGMSALHIASKNGSIDLVNLFLHYGKERIANLQDQNMATALHYSCEMGHLDIVKKLLGTEAYVDASNKDCMTPLHLASRNGFSNIVMLLLQKGADINKLDRFNAPPILYALERKHLRTAEILIEMDADVSCRQCKSLLFHSIRNGNIAIVEPVIKRCHNINDVDEENKSALHHAVIKGDYNICKALVTNLIDVNITDRYGKTPLSIAVESGSEAIVQLLIDSNAEKNMKDIEGNTPLLISIGKGKPSNEISTALIKNGSGVNAVNKEHLTPLIIASMHGNTTIVKYLVEHGAIVNSHTEDMQSPLIAAIQNGSTDVAKYLVRNKAKTNKLTPCDNGERAYPLEMAAKKGNMDLVQFLLQNKAEVNRKFVATKSALFSAAKEGHTEIVEFLLSNGATVNVGDENDASPLYISSAMGHLDVVQLLIDNSNIDVNISENKGYQIPLHIASINGHVRVVETILSNAKTNVDLQNVLGQTAIYLAAERCHVDVVDLLINKANPNITDRKRNSPLFVAISSDYGDNKEEKKKIIVEKLITHRADINTQSKKQWTPLHVATKKDFCSIVNLLLKNGGDPNINDSFNQTPVHIAAKKNNEHILKYLVGQGGKLNIQDNEKMTPLHIAAACGHLQSVIFLLKNKAAVNRKDKHSETPLHAACKHGHISIVKELINSGASIHFRNENYKTPLEVAVGDVIPYLRDYRDNMK